MSSRYNNEDGDSFIAEEAFKQQKNETIRLQEQTKTLRQELSTRNKRIHSLECKLKQYEALKKSCPDNKNLAEAFSNTISNDGNGVVKHRKQTGQPSIYLDEDVKQVRDVQLIIERLKKENETIKCENEQIKCRLSNLFKNMCKHMKASERQQTLPSGDYNHPDFMSRENSNNARDTYSCGTRNTLRAYSDGSCTSHGSEKDCRTSWSNENSEWKGDPNGRLGTAPSQDPSTTSVPKRRNFDQTVFEQPNTHLTYQKQRHIYMSTIRGESHPRPDLAVSSDLERSKEPFREDGQEYVSGSLSSENHIREIERRYHALEKEREEDRGEMQILRNKIDHLTYDLESVNQKQEYQRWEITRNKNALSETSKLGSIKEKEYLMINKELETENLRLESENDKIQQKLKALTNELRQCEEQNERISSECDNAIREKENTQLIQLNLLDEVKR